MAACRLGPRSAMDWGSFRPARAMSYNACLCNAAGLAEARLIVEALRASKPDRIT